MRKKEHELRKGFAYEVLEGYRNVRCDGPSQKSGEHRIGLVDSIWGPCTGEGSSDKPRCEGPGDYGVRDSGRRSRCDRDLGDYPVPPEASRAVDCYRQWDKQLVSTVFGCVANADPPHAPAKRERGQATVEYAVVFTGLAAVLVALAALWRGLGDGLFIEHALGAASHHIQAVAPAAIADIFLY